MIVKLFTVYDSKVKTWFTPLPFKHAGDASLVSGICQRKEV